MNGARGEAGERDDCGVAVPDAGVEGEGEEGGNKAVKAEENDLDWRRICFRGLRLAPSERLDTGEENGSSLSSAESVMVVGLRSESTLRRDERPPPRRDRRDKAGFGRALKSGTWCLQISTTRTEETRSLKEEGPTYRVRRRERRRRRRNRRGEGPLAQVEQTRNHFRPDDRRVSCVLVRMRARS